MIVYHDGNDFGQICRDVRTTSCTVPVSSVVNHLEAHQLLPYVDDIKNITFSVVYVFLNLYLGTRNLSSIARLNQKKISLLLTHQINTDKYTHINKSSLY